MLQLAAMVLRVLQDLLDAAYEVSSEHVALGLDDWSRVRLLWHRPLESETKYPVAFLRRYQAEWLICLRPCCIDFMLVKQEI